VAALLMAPSAGFTNPAAVLDHARRHAPAIERERSLAAMYRADAERLGRLPDLMVRGGAFILPVETRVGPQRARIGVAWKVPSFGRIADGQAVARAGSAMAQAAAEAAWFRVRHTVLAAWIEAAWAEAAAALIDRDVAQLARLEATIRAQIRVGKAGFADALRVSLRRDRLADRAAGLRARVPALQAQIAATAGLDEPPRLDAADLSDLDDRLAGLAGLPDEATMADHLGDAPSVRTRQATARVADAQLSAAEHVGAFEPTVAVDWTFVGAARMAGVEGDGRDAVMVSVAVPWPVTGKADDAAIDAALARTVSLRAAAAERRREVGAALASARARHADALRRRALHRDSILPRAVSALAAARTAYASGRGGFEGLIALDRERLAAELGAAEAERDALLAALQVHTLLGIPLRSDEVLR
jgi:outer membrane protein TolC